MGEHSEKGLIGAKSLDRWAHRLSKEYPELLFEVEDERLWIGSAEHPRAISVAKYETWEASTDEWHGHFDSRKDALEAALLILCGGARTAQEFRGVTLSATWLEMWLEGEQCYEVWHVAQFLNPFDRDDWCLWPGEKWRVKRVHRRLIDFPSRFEPHRQLEEHLPALGEVGEFEVEDDVPAEPAREWSLERWESQIGLPHKGFRWSNDYSYRLALQVPLGWRRTTHRDTEPNYVSFLPSEGHPLLRVTTAFRATELNGPEDETVEAASIEVRTGLEPDGAEDWKLQEWTLTFPGSTEDLWARIELFTLRSGEDDAGGWVEQFGSSLGWARHIQ